MPATLRPGRARVHRAQPVRDQRQLLVLAEVDLQRRDRDAARRHGVEIGAGPGILRVAGGADPVRGLAARGLHLHHRLGLVAAAQARRLDAAQLGERDVRHVDVEQHRHREAANASLASTRSTATCGRRLEVPADLADQRHRDRRDAEQVALGGRRDGAGVDGVVAHVGAEIDAGDHDVGQRIDHAGERQVHAVGRACRSRSESRSPRAARSAAGRASASWKPRSGRARARRR